MASGRPRRSTNSVSYVHLLKPASDLDSSSSRSSGEEDDAAAAAASGSDAPAKGAGKGKGKGKEKGKDKSKPKVKSKGKGKKRASSNDDSDGSVFELPSASASAASASDNELVDTDPDASGGGSGEDDEFSDGLASDGTATSSRPRLRDRRRTTKQRGLTSKLNDLRLMSSGGGATRRGPSSKPHAPGNPTGEEPYWGSASRQHLLGLGPRYEPPVRWCERSEGPLGSTEVETQRKPSPDVRARLSLAWSYMPFGPEKSLLQDLGWWKGKWEWDEGDGEDDEGGMRGSWGGWYDGVQARVGKRLEGSDLDPYLPKPVYLAVSQRMPTDDPEVVALEKDDNPDELEAGDTPTTFSLRMGPVSDQDDEQPLVSFERFSSQRLDDFFPTKPGYIFNAGAPVTAVAWLPRTDTLPPYPQEYLAVGTLSVPFVFAPIPAPLAASIQIWSLDVSVPTDLAQKTSTKEKGKGMALELVLCIDIGEPLDLQWCPKGGDERHERPEGDKLGLLAGVFTDGTVSVFAVPDPDAVRKEVEVEEGKLLAVSATPVLVLRLPNTTCVSFSWGSHETIAAGCVNGYVAVWQIAAALESGVRTVWPIQYFPAHYSPIRSLAFVRIPPLSTSLDGTSDPDGDPTRLITTGYDGMTMLWDLRDPSLPCPFAHDRGAAMAVCFFPYSGSGFGVDLDSHARTISLRPDILGQSRQVIQQRGAVWSVAASDHHTFVASAAADGTCTIGNAVRAQHKQTHNKKFVQKVYRVDFDRRTGEFRIVDNILPEARVNLEEQGRKKRDRAKKPAAASVPTDVIETATHGAWSPEVGVLRVAWHPNLDRACLLASGMACGLVRVDWMERGWTGATMGDLRSEDFEHVWD